MISFAPSPKPVVRWSIRFHTLIAAVVVISMTALAGVLLWQGWQGARAALFVAANQNAHDVGRLINEKARRLLAPAEANLRQLAFDRLSSAGTLNGRLEMVSMMADMLANNQLVSAVYAGYVDGSFFLLRPLDKPEIRQQFEAPPRATFVVQSVERSGSTPVVGKWVFLNASLEPLATVERPDYTFDPRERPWYDRAQKNSGQSLTDPYIFFTTQQIGLTLSERSRDGRAVVGLDVTISDLSNELGSLRQTPRTEIAVVDARRQVVAYPDASRVLRREGTGVAFSTLNDLGVPALLALMQHPAEPGKPTSFEVGGESWFGVKLALEVMPGSAMTVLVGIPDSELMGEMRAALNRQAMLGLMIAAVLLPLGWIAGRQIGQALSRLSNQGRELARFRFVPSAAHSDASRLSEVRELDGVLQRMGQTVHNFLGISETIGREVKTEEMLEKVLDRLVEVTHCTRGAVYLLSPDAQSLNLAAVSQKDGSVGVLAAPAPPPPRMGIAEGMAMAEDERVASTTERLLGKMARRSSMSIRLNGRGRQLIGLLVLDYRPDDQHDSDDFRAFAEKLSASLEVSIETRNLIESQKKLLDAVIQLLADAIDAKSPYTGGHCERVPALAEMMLDHLNTAPDLPLRGTLERGRAVRVPHGRVAARLRKDHQPRIHHRQGNQA